MQLGVGARSDSVLRCAVCRDAIGPDVVRCPRCATVLHPECRADLEGCPTLGCDPQPDEADAERPQVRVLVAGPGASRRWIASLVFFVLLGLLWTVGALLGPDRVAAWLIGVTDMAPAPPTHAAGEASTAGPVAWRDAFEGRLRAGPGRGVRQVRVRLRVGQGTIRVAQADGTGGVETDVIAGRDMVFLTAAVVPYPDSAWRELVRLSASAPGAGGTYCQYYGLTPDERLVLLRMETPQGQRTTPPPGVGGLLERTGLIVVSDPCRQTADGCRVALHREDDPIAWLDALEWMRAHVDEVARNVGPQSPTLLRHVQGADPWVAEAARAVQDALAAHDAESGRR